MLHPLIISKDIGEPEFEDDDDNHNDGEDEDDDAIQYDGPLQDGRVKRGCPH